MLTKFRQYMIALAVLVALAASYNALVTPLLEPPVIEAIGIGDESALEIDQAIVDLFPEGAWQRGLCKQLQTTEGMLLFQSWEQVENDQWRLWPVTVIIGRGLATAESEAPFILEAEQGAEIKFTESLDVMSGGAPPIQRGRMVGDVRLYRKSDGDGQQKLEVLTSNVGIDSQKIWTTEAIEMTIGSTRLVGRDLTIHLDGPSHPTDAGSNAATVLDRMELIYLDELVMPLAGGSVWEQATGDSEEQDQVVDSFDNDLIENSVADLAVSASDRDGAESDVGVARSGDEPAIISLTCGGRVEYDFALDHLSLRDSVSLVHQVRGRLSDRFDCETIQLVLNDPLNESLTRNHALDWIIGMIATGNPVVAKLPAFDAELAADRISVNIEQGILEASGSRGVQVRKNAVTARLAKLSYSFDRNQPDAIGTIDAPGAGIVQFDDPGIAVRTARWRQGVKVAPRPNTTDETQVNTQKPKEGLTSGPRQIDIWVEGDVFATMVDGGDFRADAIVGVMHKSLNSGDQVAYVPDRFEISGGVKLNTKALAADADKVLLFFVEKPEDDDDGSTNRNESDSTLRQWVVQPPLDDSKVDPVARSRPSIRGESIRAQLLLNGSEIEAKKLSVMGNVEVVHEIKSGTVLLPAKLTGDHLQLIDGGGDDVLQLTSRDGVPARLELGDGYFVGPQIQIRPHDNLIWMNAAGEFQLPSEALPIGQSKEGEVGYRWEKTPYCRWNGEMIFDGSTAVLSDGVEIDATLIRGPELWELELSGDRLQVELSNSVKVEDVKALRQASVKTITLTQSDDRPVFVQAIHRALDGVMEARHLFNARMLTLSPDDGGFLKGEGPGWYRGWVVPKPDQPLLGTGASQSFQSMDLNTRPITGAHLVFYDQLNATFEGRQLDFTRGVRIGVRPVEDWESVFDATQMDAISAGESTLDCDQLRFNLDPRERVESRVAGLSSRWEMSALSGVVFRTRNERGLLEGTASRASYSSSKDLFTVEGGPSSPAIFRQTLPDGTAGPEGAVRSMSIRPGTMKVENAVIERLNVAAPANASTP